ncbi:MAG: hypothetical protein E7148_06720 [Rikenellaceae bacterium]|nr:hypothetical protein [Rikenellaceae bacterium]
MKKIFGLMLLCATMVGTMSCEQEGEDAGSQVLLSRTSYIMYSDATITIDGSGLTNVTWSSNNEYVATANGNTLSSDKVGSTKLYCNGQRISVIVKPRYSLYTEPDMSWGSSKSSIISKYGTPFADDGQTIMYETTNTSVPYIAYMFNETGLFSCGAVVKLTAGSALVDFLGERYVFYSVNTSTYTATFAHCYGRKDNPQVDYAGKMAYQSSIGGILVVYASNSSTRGVDNDTTFKSMTEFIECNL